MGKLNYDAGLVSLQSLLFAFTFFLAIVNINAVVMLEFVGPVLHLNEGRGNVDIA